MPAYDSSDASNVKVDLALSQSMPLLGNYTGESLIENVVYVGQLVPSALPHTKLFVF